MTLALSSDWLAEHPDTTVLDLETGIYPAERYTPEENNDSAYYVCQNRPDTIFPVPEQSSDLGTKEQVFGLAFDDEARAYQLSNFQDDNVINDTLAGRNVVIFAAASGAGIRAYDSEDNVFTASAPSADSGLGLILTDKNGVDWKAEENALVSLDGSGRTIKQTPGRDSYWFGWCAFYPHTDIYTPKPQPRGNLVFLRVLVSTTSFAFYLAAYFID